MNFIRLLRVRAIVNRSALFLASVAAFASVIGLFHAAPARADVAAVYVQGEGGSMQRADGDMPLGLGWRAGAQVLFIEGYASQLYLDSGVSVSRAVVGPYIDFELGDWELVFNAGAGVIADEGGGLTGAPLPGSRAGLVARAGVALERELSALLIFGVKAEAEIFTLTGTNDATRNLAAYDESGTAVFLSAHMKFELGF